MPTKSLALSASLVLAVAAVSLPAMAQSKPNSSPTTSPATKIAAELPVTRVALFSSGVGYFEHVGTVAGDAASVLRFKTAQVNDVLKSLILQDFDGGNVSTVAYQSQDPLDKTLKGFQIDLSGAPSMSKLLAQLRGAEVAVTTSGNRYVGRILGVDVRKKVVGDTNVVDSATLNLVTTAGIQSMAINDATAIQLTDPKLQDELNQALLAVAGARDSDKKNVTVNFNGTGDRRVRMGYVVETPIWKTSYRLMISEKDKSNLQGWAIVENQTDADWNKVSLSLVSGRPISFAMDLYQPMYLTRPEAKLELFAGLTPQSYAEAKEELSFGANVGTLAASAAPMPSERGLASGMAKRSAARNRPSDAQDSILMTVDDKAANAAVVAQATSGQIGELFEYAIKDVTLARQSSAMVPIITDPIEATPVSIFNSGVLARYPLSGARIKNTTDKHLLQGPITVFQGGGYAGDAQINNVPPGQDRLISFGIDLQTLVDADKVDTYQEVQTVKVVKGVVEATNKTVASRHYAISNKGDKAKTVVIEHAKTSGWDLIDTDKPTETTDQLFRFDRKIDAKQSTDFIVKQQIVNAQQIALLNADLNTLGWYAGHGKTPDKVKDAIRKAVTLRQEQATLDRQIGENDKAIRTITEEQGRIRENMKTIDKASAYYGRLMTKLDEQESTIETTQKKVAELTAARDAKREELATYLKGLNVE